MQTGRDIMVFKKGGRRVSEEICSTTGIVM